MFMVKHFPGKGTLGSPSFPEKSVGRTLNMWEMNELGVVGPPGCAARPLVRVDDSVGSCRPQVGSRSLGRVGIIRRCWCGAVLAKPSSAAVKLGNIRCTFTEAGASDFLVKLLFCV